MRRGTPSIFTSRSVCASRSLAFQALDTDGLQGLKYLFSDSLFVRLHAPDEEKQHNLKTVLVQPEMERVRSPVSEYSALRVGIFKALGSTDPTKVWGSARR
jgi:hypothetical protein